ncbi:DUF1376 domain-containing protein [Acetobacter lambici]|uniref:YdaU family protein n=1 Tax=Acetobacter lambici TaxID=1332824 RepID=A0ABT1F001_9PROT|nr:DUF1376 domain-containing protein [Acetobacter lambici]MCP1258537.1 YdaU family protein [Acetobacter lambici]
MALDVTRLMDSDIFALSSGDEFKAAIALWCKAWLQVPAASLPDDDRVLAHLSCSGSKWKKVKPMALRGWVKCADGRLYHSVVAEKALLAWKARVAQRERAAKRWQKQEKSQGSTEVVSNKDADAHATEDATACENTMPRHTPGISHGNARDRDRDRDRESNIPSLRSGPPEPVAEPDQPIDARTLLFREGKTLLHHMTGKSDAQCGNLIGRWLKTCRDRCDLLLSIVREAAEQRPADAVSWIEGAVRHRTSKGPDAIASQWNLEGYDLDAGLENLNTEVVK